MQTKKLPNQLKNKAYNIFLCKTMLKALLPILAHPLLHIVHLIHEHHLASLAGQLPGGFFGTALTACTSPSPNPKIFLA